MGKAIKFRWWFFPLICYLVLALVLTICCVCVCVCIVFGFILYSLSWCMIYSWSISSRSHSYYFYGILFHSKIRWIFTSLKSNQMWNGMVVVYTQFGLNSCCGFIRFWKIAEWIACIAGSLNHLLLVDFLWATTPEIILYLLLWTK